METSTLGVDALLSVSERFTLKGKRAVVTGCPGGIGRASASAFADLGADVPIADNATVKGSVPLGRYGTLDEIGRHRRLPCHRPGHVHTGADILVDGGTTEW